MGFLEQIQVLVSIYSIATRYILYLFYLHVNTSSYWRNLDLDQAMKLCGVISDRESCRRLGDSSCELAAVKP